MVPKSLFKKRNTGILPQNALLANKTIAMMKALDLAMEYGAIALGFMNTNNYLAKLRMFSG